MKKIYSALAASAALVMATSAQGEAHEEGGAMPDGPNVYTVVGTLEGVTLVGGTGAEGDESYGAAWKENLSIHAANGSTTAVTANCVGMDQPDNSLFERHFTCTAEDNDDQSGAMMFGCNKQNESGTEMSCVGYFQGKEGGVAGHVSLLTAYYKFGPDGTGTMQGSGHWIR